MWDEYVIPKSVEEALQILQSREGEARIIAGGTDLVPELKDGAKNVRCLVDISEIESLRKIELDGDLIRLGAGVTHTQVASSELIREQASLLGEASAAVGSPLIRNQGTVVGNVVKRQPAADTAVALFSLCAEVEILSGKGTRRVPIGQTYEKLGVSRINSASEIVTALVHQKPSQRSRICLCSPGPAQGLGFTHAERGGCGDCKGWPLRRREDSDRSRGAVAVPFETCRGDIEACRHGFGIGSIEQQRLRPWRPSPETVL